MNFNQADQFIQSLTDYEKKPGVLYTASTYDLRRLEMLLETQGNPHKDVRTVHIAGTKGKGSTAAMIASVLIASGYKTGLFTSPHLQTIRERIQINNTMISEAEFADIVSEIKPVVEKINHENLHGILTTFEVLTAVAFVFFGRNNIELQVLEVGLGGRLDATNVVHGDVCIITSISLDHMEVLGDTLAKIAVEKTGIIKPGSIVINFPQQAEVTQIIEKTCHDRGASLVQLGKDISWHRIDGNLVKQKFMVKSGPKNYELSIPLLGDHQLENASAAVAALEALIKLGTKVSRENIGTGLSRVNWPGRLQILRYSPDVVVDGAHNRYSMKILVTAIKQYFSFNTCSVILGTAADKDIEGMIAELALLTDKIIVTKSNHPRAASPAAIAAVFDRRGIKVAISDDVEQAISTALLPSGRGDLILITGSLFIVAEAIAWANRLSYSEKSSTAQQ